VSEQEGDEKPAGQSTARGSVATRRRKVAGGDSGGALPSPPPSRPQSPFVRLARVHGLSSAGDAIVAVALAGSLFFIDPEAARSRVLLYLLLSVAPFVLVVFIHMVLGKSYAVAKASVVPSTVQSDAELVEKNSRLAVLTAVSSVAALPAAVGQLIGGSQVTTLLAAVAYLLSAVAATRLAKSDTSNADAGPAVETTGNVFLASSGMAVMRGIVGFMTFLFAFKFGGRADELELAGIGRAVGAGVRSAILDIEGQGRSLWKLGLLGACTAGGSFIGSFLAPRLRERYAEGKLLLGGLSATTVVALLATWVGGLSGASVLAFVVGFSAATSKVAFDAIVQRDAVGANHGAAFARFESRFQVAWVIGALVPVIFPIGIRVGALIMAAAAAFAAASYYFGGRSALAGTESPMSATALRRRLQSRGSTEVASTETVVDDTGESPPRAGAATGETDGDASGAANESTGGKRRRGAKRGRRSRKPSVPAAAEPVVSDDELDVPGWIGTTPPELQSIRPQRKPSSTAGTDGSPGLWDDHR